MITVISGSNSFAKQEKTRELTEEFIRVHSAEGVEHYNAESIEPHALRGMLTAVSLFAHDRLVIIKNLSTYAALSEALLAFMNSIPDEVQVLLIEDQLDKRTSFYKTLKKEATVFELNELDSSALAQWTQQYVTEQGGTITPTTADTLVRAVGSDQLRLKNEIEKLLLYSSNITQASIDELVEKTPQETVFMLLDAVLSGKLQQSLAILESMERAHEDAFAIANMLIWQTHIMAVVHAGQSKSDGEIAKAAKINPFVVKKSRLLVQRLSRTDLRKTIDTVAECDITLKTTSVDPWRVLEQTVLALG